MQSLRQQLLKIQRIAYRKNLRYIEETLADNKHLDRYAGEYNRCLHQYESISTDTELIRRVSTSDVVYHGDYHTLGQSQRSVLRVLREIVDKREIILCLEMFHSDDQRFVDQYMNREITLRELFKKINYRKTWGFNWEQWKPIIDLCKKHTIKVIGINSVHEKIKDSLLQRDMHSSKIIGKLVIRNPEALIYVVDGDYHIAPNHLPRQVEKRLDMFDIEVKRTIIYQNAPNLYWQLANDHKEDANILQIDDDSFCIMNSTPANKLQSYLNWLDSTLAAYQPEQDEWVDASEKRGNTSIPAMTKTICTILELPYPEDELESLDIYYGSNLEFMEIMNSSPVLAPLLPSVKNKLMNSEGFLIEYVKDGLDSYLIYLPNSSLNIAAEESTHFLNATLRGRQDAYLKPFDAFYNNVITEILGFFGSKLINPKRKVNSYHALRRYIGSFKSKSPNKEERKNLTLSRLILQHRYIENLSKNPEKFRTKFADIYKKGSMINRSLSTQLGYMLGDKLFYAVKKRRFSLKEVLDLFEEPFIEEYKSFKTYLDISKRVAKKKRKKRK
jgi:hypothetical protein